MPSPAPGTVSPSAAAVEAASLEDGVLAVSTIFVFGAVSGKTHSPFLPSRPAGQVMAQ